MCVCVCVESIILSLLAVWTDIVVTSYMYSLFILLFMTLYDSLTSCVGQIL